MRCCVNLKWAHTANYSEFTQWEVPLLGAASTLVYIWIWQWNIHSRAQACVHAHYRRVNMDTCGGSRLKKNSGSFAKASLRIPLQQFVFFFFFFLQHACTVYVILHGFYIQADVVSSLLQRALMSFLLLALLPKCRFPVSIKCITQYFQVGFWSSSAIFPAYLSRMRDLLSSIHDIIFQPHTNSHIQQAVWELNLRSVLLYPATFPRFPRLVRGLHF